MELNCEKWLIVCFARGDDETTRCRKTSKCVVVVHRKEEILSPHLGSFQREIIGIFNPCVEKLLNGDAVVFLEEILTLFQ